MKFEEAVNVFRDMLKKVDPHKLEEINGVCQFDITGEGGGTAQVRVHDGNAELNEGTPHVPDITIVLSGPDLVALLDGKLNPLSAFMSGKLKIKGDISLALKVQGLFGK